MRRGALDAAIAALVVVATAMPAAEPPTRAEVDALIAQGQAWLLAGQRADGAFLPDDGFALGVTAMAGAMLCEEPALATDDPRLRRAVEFVLRFRQDDGGVYDPDEGLANYGTALALQLFTSAGGVDDAVVAGARDWLLGRQNREPGSLGEGGVGYGDGKQAGSEDLSNTGYALAALARAGVPADDPAMQRALTFVERCQNLSSVNQAPWVANDGGGVYSPTDAGGSWDAAQAQGAADREKFTSTGTMSYSLLSTYLALRLTPEDERVRAALDYVRRNYRFDANPGMAAGRERQGLFYYYALMARTFALLGIDHVELPDGGSADWRADLYAAIAGHVQRTPLADGSTGAFWINEARRWGEGIPHLATVYMLGALKAIRSRLP